MMIFLQENILKKKDDDFGEDELFGGEDTNSVDDVDLT